jgi:hypothetical protein
LLLIIRSLHHSGGHDDLRFCVHSNLRVVRLFIIPSGRIPSSSASPDQLDFAACSLSARPHRSRFWSNDGADSSWAHSALFAFALAPLLRALPAPSVLSTPRFVFADNCRQIQRFHYIAHVQRQMIVSQPFTQIGRQQQLLIHVVRTKCFTHASQFTYSLIGVYCFFPDRLLNGNQQAE